MSPPGEPFAYPSTSKEEIFRATYLAQIEHGFTDLSIQQIADRVSLSKSTIYHHFDSKDTLLMEYARELLDWYIEELLFQPAGDPIENLERSLDLVFLGETEGGLALDDIRPPGLDCVYIGLRMQAARDPEMREYFDRVDSMARQRLATLVEQGIEDGTLEDVDPERVAATLYVFLEGALLLRSTETDAEWLALVRAVIDSYLGDLKADS
jgi:AcrR family transcriptional regulator